MLPRRNLFALIGLFVLTMASVRSQISFIPATIQNMNDHDSLYTIPKKPFNALGLILGTNLGVWSFDRFVTNGAYTYINFRTVKDNFRTGLVWDNDKFITNLFAHPYHGGLYFNAARSNGMNFWEAAPFTAGGSLMWEFFMENESPAINDFLATSIGGISLGEMTFRLSDMIVDDRAVGFERFKREALIALISPVRGLNRLISGEASRHRTTKGNLVSSAPVILSLAIGNRLIADDVEKNLDFSNMICIDLDLYYGDPYDLDNEKPYDYFVFRMGGNLFSNQPLVSRVNALGMIFSRDIDLKNLNHQLALGIYQHFNFYQSQADINKVSLSPYKISEAASIGPGLIYKWRLKNDINFLASAYVSAILLGGSQTDHYNVEERDYNMGSGFSSKLNLGLQFGKSAALTLNSEDYRLFSWLGYDPNDGEQANTNVQGDIGNASLSVARLSFSYIINKHFTLSTEAGYYYRKSIYRYFPDVEHRVRENKISVGYIF